MNFGLLRFWEIMTQVVTWRSSRKCKQHCCRWRVVERDSK